MILCNSRRRPLKESGESFVDRSFRRTAPHIADGMASPAPSEPAVPTAAAVLVYRDARSEPMPTDAVLPVADEATPAHMPFACLGVAYAMHVLLEHFGEPGRVPENFDERRHPLCGPNAPLGIVSFVWTDHMPFLPLPRFHTVHDFVLLVVSRLQLTLKEVVLAYGILEQLVNDQPVYAQAHCLRPIFLIACVIANKVTNDVPYYIGSCYDDLRDVFTATSIPLMKRMERQLLFLLGFDMPVGAILENCAQTRHPSTPHARIQHPPTNTCRPPCLPCSLLDAQMLQLST